MNTYRVLAKYTTYVYLDIEANSEDEAYDIAYKADSDNYKEDLYIPQGDWDIYDCRLIKTDNNSEAETE